jgi:hypothetical protein
MVIMSCNDKNPQSADSLRDETWSRDFQNEKWKPLTHDVGEHLS